MRWSRAVPAAATLIVLIAAGVVYGQVVPVSHVERGRLSQLVIPHAPPGYAAKPINAGEVTSSSNPFTGVQDAAKRSPNATGSYSSQWSVTGTDTDANVDVVLASLLPTTAEATAVLGQAKTTYLTAKSLSSDGYSLKGSVTVPGVPGAQGSAFSSTTKGDYPVAVVVFRVNRVVVVAFGQQTASVAKAEAAATALVGLEYQQLVKVTPGFSLVKTTKPLGKSLVYAAISVGAAALVCVVLILAFWWRRRTQAREAARQEAIRQAQERDRRRRAARKAERE